MESLGRLSPEFYPVLSSNGNSYYFTDDPDVKDDALTTLKKIETIVKNKAGYAHPTPTRDKLRKYTLDQLNDQLQAITNRVYNEYMQENAKKGSTKTKEKIQQVKQRIDNYLSAPESLGLPLPVEVLAEIPESLGLPLPIEILAEIATYLDIPSLLVLRQVNRQAQAAAYIVLREKAKEYGYEPVSASDQQVFDYLKGLAGELKNLRQEGLLTKPLDKLTPFEILMKMADPRILSPSYTKFRKALVLEAKRDKHKQKFSEIYQNFSEKNQRLEKGEKIFVEEPFENKLFLMNGYEFAQKLAQSEDENFIKYLLSVKVLSVGIILTGAARVGSKKILKVCLNATPKNQKASACTNALIAVCLQGKDDPRIHETIKLLLKNGADAALAMRNARRIFKLPANMEKLLTSILQEDKT